MRRLLALLVLAILMSPATAESQVNSRIELDPATKDSVLDAALSDLVLGHTLGMEAGQPVYLSPESSAGDSVPATQHRASWIDAAIRRYRFAAACAQTSDTCPTKPGALFLTLREPEVQSNGLVLVNTSYLALHPMVSGRQPFARQPNTASERAIP